MSEENKPQDEIVGLEAGDLIEEPVEPKMTIPDYLKKYKIYVASGFGTVVVTVLIIVFLTGGKTKESSEIIEGKLTEEHAIVDLPDHKIASPVNLHESNVESGNHSNEAIEHFDPNEIQPEYDEPSLSEAIYEWTPEELIELAKLKSAPKDTVENDNVHALSIDTARILSELDDIFALPDMEGVLELTAKDSADTVNWIDKELNRIAVEQAKLDKAKEELSRMEAHVNNSLDKIGQVESQRMIKLAKLYDNMKPLEVAKLFTILSDSVVIRLIPRMKQTNVSKILALLPPRRAASISKQLVTISEN